MSKIVKALVLYGVGLNCDHETARAFELAGASAERVIISRLEESPESLLEYDIFAIPGGFSYGDDISAGAVLAAKLKRRIGDSLSKFIESGRPVVGICNGYQALAKGGFLPDLSGETKQEVTLTYNDSGRFTDRWIHLTSGRSVCKFTEGIDDIELPVRHGEGKFVCTDETLGLLQENNLVVFRYADANGDPTQTYPLNPNGSMDAVAAICNRQGNVLGIMPHPEAYVDRTQHPRWTREKLPEEGAGLKIFRNIVKYATA